MSVLVLFTAQNTCSTAVLACCKHSIANTISISGNKMAVPSRCFRVNTAAENSCNEGLLSLSMAVFPNYHPKLSKACKALAETKLEKACASDALDAADPFMHTVVSKSFKCLKTKEICFIMWLML